MHKNPLDALKSATESRRAHLDGHPLPDEVGDGVMVGEPPTTKAAIKTEKKKVFPIGIKGRGLYHDVRLKHDT